MRIAIYGAGNCGRNVFHEICSNKLAEKSISCWIDNFQEQKELYGLPIYTEEAFFSEEKPAKDDVIIVAILHTRTAQEVVLSLLSRGVERVYLATRELKVRGGGTIKPYREIKPVLRYIHISVTNRCNLNCKKCLNFSNLVKQTDVLDLDRFESYLIQLDKRFSSILTFNLLGGEPLLNPQLERYISLIRRYFPETRINILTNGLLILQMSQTLIETMTECHAAFEIGQYPPTQIQLNQIVAFLEKNHIDYRVSSPITKFEKMITLNQEDGCEAFKKRMQKMRDCECSTIDDGRIYLCMGIPRLYAMKDYFDVQIEEEELIKSSIDLMKNEDPGEGWDIIQKLKSPVSLCRFCSAKDIWENWEVGIPQREDWIAD